MLGWRILISVVLIPALIILFRLDQAEGETARILLGFCLLLAARNSWEMTELLNVRTMRPSFPAVAACSLLVILAAWGHTWCDAPDAGSRILFSLGWIAAGATLSFSLLLMREASVYQDPGHSLESLGANFVSVFYGGVLLAVTAQFRWFPDPDIAYFAIGSMIIAVKSGDIGAYSFGRLWGRRKMAPRLSPGKTWMGFVGALSGSVVGGSLWLTFGGQLFDARPAALGWTVVLLYSAAMGVVGLLGDLLESLIKRDAGKKDSAALLPGFGGLLDILDSPLFAGPVAVAWWQIWPPAASTLPGPF